MLNDLCFEEEKVRLGRRAEHGSRGCRAEAGCGGGGRRAGRGGGRGGGGPDTGRVGPDAGRAGGGRRARRYRHRTQRGRLSAEGISWIIWLGTVGGHRVEGGRGVRG